MKVCVQVVVDIDVSQWSTKGATREEVAEAVAEVTERILQDQLGDDRWNYLNEPVKATVDFYELTEAEKNAYAHR